MAPPVEARSPDRKSPLFAGSTRLGVHQTCRTISSVGIAQEDSWCQSKRRFAFPPLDPGRVRVNIPGGARPVEIRSQRLLHPRQKEVERLSRILRTSILANTRLFHSQFASTPITTRLPELVPTQVSTQQPQSNVAATTPATFPAAHSRTTSSSSYTDFSGNPNSFPLSCSDHESVHLQSAFPDFPNMSPSARSAPPDLMSRLSPGPRPASNAPPHKRNGVNAQGIASSPFLPQGGYSPAGRSHRDQCAPISDRGWKEKYNTKIRFVGFPRTVTTLEVWSAFSKQGNIESIELNFDQQANPEGSGLIRFKPPPSVDFWNRGPYHVKRIRNPLPFTVRLVYLGSDEKRLYSGIQNHEARYPETTEVRAECLEFGVLTEPLIMHSMYRTSAGQGLQISMSQDLKNRRIELDFPVRIPVNQAPGGQGRTPDVLLFKMQMSHTQKIMIYEVMYPDSPDFTALVVTVDTPPLFWRKRPESQSHTTGESRWFARDCWWRQTDISYDPSKSRGLPTSLKREAFPVNVGRWKTYRILFDLKKCRHGEYTRLINALRDFNISVQARPNFLLTSRMITPVWNYLDRQNSTSIQPTQSDLAQLMDGIVPLAFEVRYQLEVCISEGLLSEYRMSRMFLEELHKLDVPSAMALLEAVSSNQQRFFDPMDIFRDVTQTVPRRQIPSYCMYMRTVVVTPTTIYFTSPTLEISNRVARQYRDYADRFLRVRFQDEKQEGKIYGSQREQMNELFTRVKRTMANGIVIGDRHYEFLAFGNSQFREHGAFFFAPTQYLSVAKIRQWMGDFEGIRVVAKYAARLGQCFSTTRAIHTVRPRIVETMDITTADGSYTFSDGVGKVSRFLAWMAAKETGALVNDTPPSLMQFRLGGAKGVLAIWPQAKEREIHMRPSQFKFSAAYEGLEIIRWSQFSAAHLNRQLITVLSDRGIADDVFIKKLDEKIADLDNAMTDPRLAYDTLQKEVDPNRMSLTLASMIENGFQVANEPFMMSILKLWRAFSIKYLKEKAKIPIHKGAVLLGCVDESGKLRGYFKDQQPERNIINNANALPEIFVQVSCAYGWKPRVMTGIMAVARNPSLYPGDIQVVRGVDLPELRHLVDVVVFPNHGDRDIPSMLSGGDLDGDDFVVIWDQELIPKTWHEPPADFAAATPEIVDHEPTIDEITTFFVQYMQNDSLGIIGTAHLAMADGSQFGVRDARCIALADLHSRAVDYNKTGQKAVMPPRLRPPRFPHFMERKGSRTYTSQTALGKLYDRVDLVDFAPDYDAPFHEGILNAYSIDKEILDAAKEIKGRYDQAVRRIMRQYDIGTDFEVWSTFVMRHANFSNDFKFYEKISDSYKAVKDTFRKECEAKAGGDDHDTVAPFVAAMYKVTQEEVADALQERARVDADEGQERSSHINSERDMPFMSFPWLFPDRLGTIATESSGRPAALSKRAFIAPKRQPKPEGSKMLAPTDNSSEEDLLLTKDGVVHIGDTLSLFHDEERTGEDSSGPTTVPTPASESSLAPEAAEAGAGAPADAMSSLSIAENPGTISPFFNSPLADSPFADRKGPSPVIDAHLKSSSKLRNEPMASIGSLLHENEEVQKSNSVDVGMDESGDESSGEVEMVLPTSQKSDPFDQLASLNAE